jgi:hypothetical protein
VLRASISSRNLLQPVNRLPPEVLAYCATFVSDTDPRPIISLTHVCRYWYKVICSSPRNWGLIGTRWRRLASLCLERAKAAPLAADIVVSESREDESFLRALLPHVPRIGSLRLTEYSSVEAVVHDLPGLFDSPILNLVSLELQQSEAPIHPFPSNRTPAPSVFQNVRALKSLRLTQTPIYPALFKIASLVELKLTGYTSPFDFETFVTFLGSHLALELVDLDLRFAIGSVWRTPVRKVRLTRLRHLSIACPEAIDSKGLLSCIPLPRGTHLEVFFNKPGGYVNLTSLLPSYLKGMRKLLHPISTIKTRYTPPMLHLSGNNSVLSLNALGCQLALYSGISQYSTAAVREFHLNIHPRSFTDNRLLWVLERLPALEILAIIETAFPLGAPRMLARKPLLCPSLKTIAFFNCGIPEGVIKELGNAIATRRDSFATQLYRVVIIDSTAVLPNLKVIQRLMRSVPCVEVRADNELPDLSRLRV